MYIYINDNKLNYEQLKHLPLTTKVTDNIVIIHNNNIIIIAPITLPVIISTIPPPLCAGTPVFCVFNNK